MWYVVAFPTMERIAPMAAMMPTMVYIKATMRANHFLHQPAHLSTSSCIATVSLGQASR